jgi:hypothetical protein
MTRARGATSPSRSSEEVAADPERLARLNARRGSFLNHPNIATLHGFETEGRSASW